jgi:hypothetical protein
MSKLHDHLIGLADRKPQVSDPKVDVILNNMEEIPEVVTAGSKWAVDAWVRLGSPTSPFTESGEKLVNVLIAMWEEMYPQDSHDWYEQRREYQKEELDVTTQVQKKTGGSLASFPYPLFQMFKRFFPDTKFTGITGRDTCKKMVRRWPMFKLSKFRS